LAAKLRAAAPQVEAEAQALNPYEIRWANLPAPVGRRPVLLLSRPQAYKYLTRFVVAELTTSVRGIPQEVALGPKEGLPLACVANLDNIHVVHKSRLKDLLGILRPHRQREVKRALGYALGWPELKVL
jgi:mRNA interferase MazF